MAVLDHNDNHVSWLAHRDLTLNESSLRVLRGAMLALAGVVGVSLAIALLREIAGDLDQPATGIVFTLPIDRVEGLAPERGHEASPI